MDLYPTFICNTNSYHSFGKGTDDQFYIWGCQQHDPQLFPPSPDGSPWRDFVGFKKQTIAITCDGKAYVYEFEHPSELANVKPVAIDNLWKSFVFGQWHVIGITLDDKAYWWETNRNKLDLGVGPKILRCPDHETWDIFYCSQHHTIGMTKNKKVYVWNHAFKKTNKIDCHLQLMEPPHHSTFWRKFFCFQHYTFGSTLDGTMYVWGDSKKSFHFVTLPPRVFPPQSPDDPWVDIFSDEKNQCFFGKTRSGKIYIWGPGRNSLLVKDKNSPRDVPTEMLHPDQGVTWINVLGGVCLSVIVMDSNFNLYDVFEHPSKIPPPPRGVKWKIFCQDLTNFDLLEALSQQTFFSDIKIGQYNVHSTLIQLRCPSLLTVSNINGLQNEALFLLLRLIYGESERCLYFVDIPTLFDLYRFLRSRGVSYFQSIVYRVILEMMKQKQKLIDVVELSTRFELDEIFSETLDHKYLSILFPEELSEEEILHQINEIKSDKFKAYLATRYISQHVAYHPHKKRKQIVLSQVTDHHVDNVKNLQDCLRKLYQTGEGSDLTIVFGQQRFPVHRYILCARSKYFQNLLQPSFKEFNMSEIDLSKIQASPQSMNKFLEFVYCESISPSDTESVELLVLQDFFLFENQELSRLCKTAIETSKDEQSVLSLAYHHRNHQALRIILPKFVTKNIIYSKLASPTWCENFASLLLSE